MDNLVQLSQNPFQILSLICLTAAACFMLRVLFSWVFPDVVFLDQITMGLLLNAIVICTLLIVGILSLVGEFVIRSFTVLTKDPLYIIREIHKK